MSSTTHTLTGGRARSLAALEAHRLPGREAQARSRRCQWCARTAMRGVDWCYWHRPGPRPPLNRRPRRPLSDISRAAFCEASARRRLPPELQAWPPLARMLATTRPGERIVAGCRHVVEALVREALGDAGAWPALLDRMREAGFLAPNDPPRPVLLDSLPLAWLPGEAQDTGQDTP